MNAQWRTRQQVSVCSFGMVSSVGLNADSSCAAIRARLSRFEELPFHDGSGEKIIGAPATEAVPNRQGYQRLAPLLASAVRECLHRRIHENWSSNTKPLLLVAVDDLRRPDYPKDISERLLIDVGSLLRLQWDARSAVFAHGRTAFFRALAEARQILGGGDVGACLVAGVDSLLNTHALEWLQSQDRLKTEDNLDGVIPGEAAAAVWIERMGQARPRFLDVLGIGFGEEASVLEPDTPNIARGLADAFRKALAEAAMPLHEVDFRVGGMTGERAEFMEASTALARIQRVHKDDFALWVPAEQLGDVGAALPACMMVVTAVGFTKGYAPGRSALLFTSSHSSERAACIVSEPRGGQHAK